MKNADLPAMPNDTDPQTLTCMGLMNNVSDFYRHGTGLTKREMFAMAAMQGLLAGNTARELYELTKNGETPLDYITRQSTDLADALLAELERTK